MDDQNKRKRSWWETLRENFVFHILGVLLMGSATLSFYRGDIGTGIVTVFIAMVLAFLIGVPL